MPAIMPSRPTSLASGARPARRHLRVVLHSRPMWSDTQYHGGEAGQGELRTFPGARRLLVIQRSPPASREIIGAFESAGEYHEALGVESHGDA